MCCVNASIVPERENPAEAGFSTDGMKKFFY